MYFHLILELFWSVRQKKQVPHSLLITFTKGRDNRNTITLYETD